MKQNQTSMISASHCFRFLHRKPNLRQLLTRSRCVGWQEPAHHQHSKPC